MSKLKELLTELEEYDEERTGEVKLPKGSALDLHFLEETEEYPSFEEFDSKYTESGKDRRYILEVVNLRSRSKKPKIFKCRPATFKKIGKAMLSEMDGGYGVRDLHLFNPIEQNAGVIVSKSELGEE
jgi:hypothetical protein